MPDNISSRLITSLAVLKANWDTRHFDFVENFVPFFSHLIKIKKYKEINSENFSNLRSDFEKEYGMSMPYHPAKQILTRLRKSGLIISRQGKYFIDENKTSESVFEDISSEQQRKLAHLIKSLITFANQESYAFSSESAEEALIAFLKENNLGFLSAAKEPSILPEFNQGKSAKYIVAKFIYEAKKADPNIFNFLTDVAVGVALANTIAYGENLINLSVTDNLNLYLDTGYIFTLIGIEGEEKKQAFSELTKSLLEIGAKLFVFDHTYDESMVILNGALYWLRQGTYEMKKASKTLKYFISNGFNESDVELFIAQIPKIFNEYQIKKISKPNYSEDIKYQISEAELKNLIVETYKSSDPFFDEFQKEETISRDVESIYSICKLRKGHIAYTLMDASHIFVTLNHSLAKVSAIIQSDDNVPFSVPPCITDVLIGTLVWLQQPAKVKILNEKKLISDAYAAIQPDKALIKRYLEEVDNLKNRGEITSDEYYILRTNRVAFNLLSEKTKNDCASFEPRTTREIMDEINKEHTAELQKELDKEKQAKTEKTVESEKQRLRAERYERVVQRFVSILTWGIMLVIIPIVITLLAINAFPNYFQSFFLQLLAFAFVVLITFSGFSLFRVKKWLFSKIKNFLIR
jgi:hypothetical protein